MFSTKLKDTLADPVSSEKVRQIGKDFTDEEKSTFKAPDRKLEDRLVKSYQETGEKAVHEELFSMREPTIGVWAKRYSWVSGSEEDLFSELSIVWLKCVRCYKFEADIRPVRTKVGHLVKDDEGQVKTVFKRTPFNTFLFTSFRNHILNMLKKKHSKKRLDADGNPIENSMKSLDYEYGDEGDGTNLYDLLTIEDETQSSAISAQWIVDLVSGDDEEVRQVLTRFMNDKHIKDLKTVTMMRSGTIRTKKSDLQVLLPMNRVSNKRLKELIEATGKYGSEFQISSWQIFTKPNRVKFEIFVKDERLCHKVECAINRVKDKLMK